MAVIYYCPGSLRIFPLLVLTWLFTGELFYFSIFKREIALETEVWVHLGEGRGAQWGRTESSHNMQMRTLSSIISRYCHYLSIMFLKPFTCQVFSPLMGGKAPGISQGQAQKYATSCEMTVSICISEGRWDWCEFHLLSFGEQKGRGNVSNSLEKATI